MFTQEQLDVIKYAARNRKNQGELSVYIFATSPFLGYDAITEHHEVLKYCAEECKRQRSGEMSVYDMVNAWSYTTSFDAQPGMPEKYKHPNISLAFIEHIGRMIEPDDNKKGFRTIRIGIQNGFNWIEKAPPDRVVPQLEALLYAYYHNLIFSQESRDNGWVDENRPEFKAQNAEDMFYLHYENIHPFVDGNGRSGKILYNYLCGTLENPIMPPNFWGGSNP